MLQRKQIIKEEQAGYWAPPDSYLYDDPEIMLDYSDNKMHSKGKSSKSQRQKSAGSNFGGSEGRSQSKSPGKGKSSMIEKEKAQLEKIK